MAYREEAAKKSDFERAELAKDKTGVCIDGLTAVNPVNGKEIPVWISDYVLMSYGTGAIMAVPAHDERDWEFAKKFNLPMIQVVAKNGEEVDINEAAFTDVATGVLINSDFLNGLEVKDAKAKMIEFLEEKGIGTAKTNYKLRDWVFSRQRYWGEPIPIVHCDKCGYVPIDESELPLMLPEVDSYMPTDKNNMTRQYIDDYLQENQIIIKDSIDISDMDLLIDFARIGVGVACVIKNFVREDLENGTLVEIPLGFPIHKREVGFAYKTTTKPSKSLAEFIHFYKTYR